MKPISLSRFGFFAGLAAALAFSITSHAGTATETTTESSSESALSDWWNGKYATGNWFGVRDTLEDHGIKPNGKYYGAFFGVVDSQGGSRGFWDQGLELGLDINVGKLTKIEGLEGVKMFANGRWRDPRQAADPNQFVEANSMFNPSNWVSGVYWRLLSFGVEVTSKDYLPVKDMIVLRGGWLQPQKEFVDQPLSKLFMNNAVNSAKGIGGNIPFSSSFSSWGGTALVRPTDWSYAKAGFFMAFPNATSSLNQGVNFGGTPGSNGLMAMAETGVTPKLGASELPGKYATGAYYWGQEKDSFNGTPQYGQYGFYFQADQMVYREPSPEEPAPLGKGPTDGKSVASGKSFKAPVSSEKPTLSKQGLSLFNLITFSPKYNNVFPFYFQTGMVYQGLIPTRDDDQIGASLAFGNYSYYQTLANRADNDPYQPNYTIFLEGFYRVQINQWAYFQPFIQYVIRPDGSSAVQNATVLGFATGVTF
jgi:carbohydrate-selective porin OprB